MGMAVGIAGVIDEATHRALPRGIDDLEDWAGVENHEVCVLLLCVRLLPPLVHSPVEDFAHVLDDERSLLNVLHSEEGPASLVHLLYLRPDVLTLLKPLVLARVPARAEARGTLDVDLPEGAGLISAGNLALDGEAVADGDIVDAQLGVLAMQVGIPSQHHEGDRVNSSSCPPRPLQVLLVLLRKPLGIIPLHHGALAVLDHCQPKVPISERDRGVRQRHVGVLQLLQRRPHLLR
mmetsp:Transcript_51898/g.161471  ORF Transcript_51898/g.161471 Transcript_51898/m.161471 type:complete len:235 (-) Transcript_51898:140-844(-)